MDFVGVLHRHEIVLEGGIVRPLFQLAEFIKVLDPGIADLRGDQVGKARVGGQKPAARRDAVGLVVDASRIKGVEVGEKMLFEQVRVQGRDAVD